MRKQEQESVARANNTSDESLDLLLDTICNTFGGVLFISMLVVILLNMSSESTTTLIVPEQSRQEMLNARASLVESSAELERLRRAASERQSITQKFANPEVAVQLAELQQMTSLNQSIRQSRDQLLSSLVNTQEAINDAVSQAEQLKQAQQQLSAALANLESQVQQEVSLRTRTAELPKQRRTQKRQVAFLMKNGKLYAHAKSDGNGNVAGQNESEVKQLTEGNKIYVEPVSSAGLAVNADSDDLAPIESKINQFSKDDYFIVIVVWPDSFPQFLAVKEAIIRSEFEYQLVPWSGDEKLYVGTTSEQGGVVQ